MSVPSCLTVAAPFADDTAEDLPVVSIDGPYPDLVEARERWPKLTDLWNAVRHDFWSQMTLHAYGRSTRADSDRQLGSIGSDPPVSRDRRMAA